MLASCNCLSEDIIVDVVIIAELEFGDIKRKILAADFVVAATDAALEDAPKALNRLSMDRADNVLMFCMVNDRVGNFSPR